MNFLHRAHHNLLELRNTRYQALQHYTWGPFLRSKITKKKHKNGNKVVLSRLQRGHLVKIRELKQGQALHPSASNGSICVRWLKLFATLCVHEWLQARWVLIWGSQMGFSTNSKIQNPWKMRADYISKGSFSTLRYQQGFSNNVKSLFFFTISQVILFSLIFIGL